uniref:Uncharacterized protein n=1 Tax=Chromera velia CCMP2878 TaxID=1169474 RepID=A0A0G4F7T0_9ALVE|eukprot:Cvel_15656.t1-p1 / transcript=Cvel_15656.t1 / gene=Cvel_15656 / organism=Chromera_velia_CCMP2878 / gene_product=hypothetical protein / transcript_product=hypothetical protein / location=Cvel_scaffold1168:39222-39947(+) / protein_length=242 / sequence_SO=supercontig / SO=protein_coding / is_pseudo=false
MASSLRQMRRRPISSNALREVEEEVVQTKAPSRCIPDLVKKAMALAPLVLAPNFAHAAGIYYTDHPIMLPPDLAESIQPNLEPFLKWAYTGLNIIPATFLVTVPMYLLVWSSQTKGYNSLFEETNKMEAPLKFDEIQGRCDDYLSFSDILINTKNDQYAAKQSLFALTTDALEHANFAKFNNELAYEFPKLLFKKQEQYREEEGKFLSFFPEEEEEGHEEPEDPGWSWQQGKLGGRSVRLGR